MPFTFTRFASVLAPAEVSPAPTFETIDGQLVSYEEGEQALRSGAAVLVGGLLVVSSIACLLRYATHVGNPSYPAVNTAA